MQRTPLLEWEGREYEHQPKSADWYWALGIVGVASAVAAILFGNFLFAILILIAVITIALHAAKEPPLHRFQLLETGLIIGEDFHPFEEMNSFAVLEDIDGKLPPVLSIKTEKWYAPHLVIPLDGVDAELIYSYFLHHVDEDDHKPTFTDLVAAWLGL